MKASLPWALSLLLSCCVVGCGDDDGGEGNTSGKGNTAGSGGSNSAGTNSAGGGSGGSNSGGNSTSGSNSGGDRCREGCMATIAANCTLSPDDQASCERDCHDLESGDCGTEYDAFQDCAEGKTVSCDPIAGFPIVAGCETQQSAFITCQQ